MQTRQSLHCSHTQSLDVDEDWYQNFGLPSQIHQHGCLKRFLCVCDKYQNLVLAILFMCDPDPIFWLICKLCKASHFLFSSVEFKGFEVEKFSEY